MAHLFTQDAPVQSSSASLVDKTLMLRRRPERLCNNIGGVNGSRLSFLIMQLLLSSLQCMKQSLWSLILLR